jgi:hypothetical protein
MKLKKLISKTALATATAAFAFGMNGVFGDGQSSGSSSVSCSVSSQFGDKIWYCSSGQQCAATCTDLGGGEIELKLYCCPSTATDIEDCTLNSSTKTNQGPCSGWSLPTL